MTQPVVPRTALRLHDDLHFQWLRGSASYADGWLQIDKGTLTGISPEKMTDPAFEFAAVRSPADAVRFVERYGLMHQGLLDSEFRERFGVEEGGLSFREPFAEWDVQTRRVRTALRIYHLINRVLADEGRDDALAELRSTSDIRDYIEKYDEPEPETDDQFLDEASLVVANLVHPGLREVTIGVGSTVTTRREDASPARFFMRPQPVDMLGYIYYRLMLLIVGQGPIKECEECHRVFPVEDKRQRYCSKPCGARVRYRRFKDSPAGSKRRKS